MLVLNVRDDAKPITIDRAPALIRSMGTRAYVAEVLTSLAAQIPIDSAIIFCFEKKRPACIQDMATNCSKANLDRTAQKFAHSFSHLDPNANILELEAPESARILFTRTESRDILDQRYWQTCWQSSGVVDRCSFIGGDPNKWWALNLYRERTSGVFSEGELAFLIGMAPLVGPLTQKHLEFQRNRSPPHSQLDMAVKGLEVLTAREQQVCSGIVRGQTAQGIAIDLGIGMTSVITYRKRAYIKLGISTRYELLKACMDQISYNAAQTDEWLEEVPSR